MFELFGGQTPNVFKPLIMLEELGTDYRRVPVDILQGEQFTPSFLAISPNNRVPAIVDHDPEDEGEPLSVFESGAILLYLADKYRSLIPQDARGRSAVIEWVMWQMAGQGPMAGQAGHFRHYAPEPIPYAIDRYTNEVRRLYRVLDTRLQGREFIAGAYSIADIACWPWIFFRDYHGVEVEEYPELHRWFRAIESRPAVRRALGDFELSPAPKFTEEERAVLFGQQQK
jgi:GST-like protein